MLSLVHTRFSRLSPRQAAIVLAVSCTSTLFLVGVTCSPLKSGFADAPPRGASDVDLYQAEVERIHDGQAYYDAAAIELRERGYPTRSVFNWRTPLPMVLIGSLPDPRLAQALLCGLAVALGLLSFKLVAEQLGTAAAATTSLCLAGALLPCFLSELFVMPEVWSGVLIALSAVAYGCERRQTGFAAGLSALWLRELAAPYVLICAGLALYQRRWREALAWCLGLAAFAGFYAFHVAQVLPRIGPLDIAHQQGWLRFGAAGFVISTVQMNVWLLLLPQAITAVYLAATLLGAAGWSTTAGTRIGLTLACYVAAFSIVGQAFNQYWGSMTAPLFSLAAGAFLPAVADLWHATRRSLGSPAAAAAPLDR